MNKDFKNSWIWLLVLSVVSLSCQTNLLTEKLNQAESVVWSMPDSAYSLLNEFPLSALRTESDRAKYALLITQTSTRIVRTIKSDSLINMAMKYYSSHKNTNEYALTCLLRGNIMEYLGNDEEALRMYLTASNAMYELTDRRIYFLVYTSLGNFYARYAFYRDAIINFENALALDLPTPLWKEVDYKVAFKPVIRIYPIDDWQIDTWKSLLEKITVKMEQRGLKAMYSIQTDKETLHEEYTEAERKRLQDIQLQYKFSMLINQNTELRHQWTMYLLISVTVIIILLGAIYQGKKYYQKKRLVQLNQHQEEVSILQNKIADYKELESATKMWINQIACLEEDNRAKEQRIRQLETIFRAKNLTLSAEMVESAQVYLRIVDRDIMYYNPIEDRSGLAKWINVTCKQFAVRLSETFPALTNGDKDICYLFALNLSFEEVAKVLNVQPRSVERSVCRICQRMGLMQNGKDEFLQVIKRMVLFE